MTPSASSSSSSVKSPPDGPTAPDSAAIKASLWNIFAPPSGPSSDPSQVSSLSPSSPFSSSDFQRKLPSSITTYSSGHVKKHTRRARFENDPHLPVSKPCCRRCGREIAPGMKRAVSKSKGHHHTHTESDITEIPVMLQEPVPSSPPLSPLPPLVPIPDPIVKREKSVASFSRSPSPQRKFATHFPSGRPSSAVTTNSELVERTKGLMAALSPHTATSTTSTSSAPSRASSLQRSIAIPARLKPLSQLMSNARPIRWASWSSDKVRRGRPAIESSVKSIRSEPDGAPTSPHSRQPIASDSVLDISREATSKVETDTSGPEDSPVQVSPSLEPRFLEVSISDTASILCMSSYLASLFEHQPPGDSTHHFHIRDAQNSELLQDILHPEPKFQDEYAVHEDPAQELEVEMDWNKLMARESGELSAQALSPLEFSGDGDVSSLEDAAIRPRSWIVRPRRSSRRPPPMTWAPPESWAGPPQTTSSEDPQRQPLDEESRTNTFTSSLDDHLKPLTYLIHHHQTSSIDVCSTSDQAKASSEGCLPSSEGSLDADEVSIDAKVVRVRKYGWHESAAVLEVIPKLKDLRLGKNRK